MKQARRLAQREKHRQQKLLKRALNNGTYRPEDWTEYRNKTTKTGSVITTLLIRGGKPTA